MKQTCPACKSKDLALEAANVTIENLMAQRLKLLDALNTATTVELPECKYIDRHDVPKEGMCVYTKDQLLQVDAAAEQRGYQRGLGEVITAIEIANADGVIHVPDCIEIIEALKGKS